MIRAVLGYIKLLHILMLAGIGIFAFYFVWPKYGQPISVTLPEFKKTAEVQKSPNAVEVKIPGIMEYAVIAEQNLFHPERKIPVEKKGKPPEPRPEIVLYGTIVFDNLTLAYIEDKKREYAPTPGRGKRHRTVKIGDNIQGFIVKEIKTDSIMLQKGEEKIFASLKKSGEKKALSPPQKFERF
jgi:hypothetical protein